MNHVSIERAKSLTDTYWHLLVLFAAVIGASMLPQDAYAQNAFSKVLCNIVDFVKGPAGKAIATVAVIVIGLGALMGKVSWGLALIVAIGIALIFGAPSIVGAIASGDGNEFECSGGDVTE